MYPISGNSEVQGGVASWSVNMIDMQASGLLPSKVGGWALRDNQVQTPAQEGDGTANTAEA